MLSLFQCLSASAIFTVSSSRSSNRTCGFPASAFHLKSCFRLGKAGDRLQQACQTMVIIQSLGGKLHLPPTSRLALPTQPLTEPITGMTISRLVGGEAFPGQKQFARPHSRWASPPCVVCISRRADQRVNGPGTELPHSNVHAGYGGINCLRSPVSL